MNCERCICNICARSVALPCQYFTAGEVEDVDTFCFVCEDECRVYDGDPGKRVRRRFQCKNFIQARKYTKFREENDARAAEQRRKKFYRLK